MNGLLPKATPENLEIRAKPRKVMHLNRKAVTIIAGVMGSIAILIGTLGGMGKRSAPVVMPESTPAPPNARPEGIATLPEDYGSWRPIPQLGPPAGELGRPVLSAERQSGVDAPAESFKQDPEIDAQRVSRLRLQDEAEAAVKSNVMVQLRHTTANSSLRPSRARLASEAGGEAPAPAMLAQAASATQGESDQQRKSASFESTHPESLLAAQGIQEAASPYRLMAGSVIPAALVTGINSDLPGQTIATVTENVYDTVTGRYLLIPQGSRMIGQYDSQVSFGQRRVLLVWTRLIMPSGDSVELGRLSAADLTGSAGLEDRVDWHWDRVFAGAAVSTLLGINAQLADTDRNGNSRTLIVASRQSAQDAINEVGQQLTRRNLNIQPTLSIRPGFAFRVLINKDLALPPHSSAQRRNNP